MKLFLVVATVLCISGLGVREQIYTEINSKGRTLGVKASEHLDLAEPKADTEIIGKIIMDESVKRWCDNHAKECTDGAIKPLRKNPTLSEDEFRSGLYKDASAAEWRSREMNGWLGLANIKVSMIAIAHGDNETIVWSHEDWENNGTEIFTVLDSDLVQSEHRLMVEWERPAWYALYGGWDEEHPGFITVWTPARIAGNAVGKFLTGSSVSSISHGDLIPQDITLLVHSYVGARWQENTMILRNFQRNSWVYHAAGLLTWLDKDGRDPGFVTIVELDFVNGLVLRVSKGAYVWSYEEPQTELWNTIRTQHPFMHAPVLPEYSELNVWDLPMDAATFKTFFKETGVSLGRWENPHMTSPMPVTTAINRRQVMESLWRYVQNKPKYSPSSDNCQTFITDFVRHLNHDKELDIFGVGTHKFDLIAKGFRHFYMSYTPHPELFNMTPF